MKDKLFKLVTLKENPLASQDSIIKKQKEFEFVDIANLSNEERILLGKALE